MADLTQIRSILAMDQLKIRGTIGFDVLNLIGLVGLRLRSQKPGLQDTENFFGMN